MATVTKESIREKIKSVYYLNAGSALAMMDKIDEADKANLSLVTICIIILENGFKVDGVSACVDPANYNEDIGRSCAYEDAFNKIWELEGYMLRQSLHEKAESQAMLASFAENNKCEGGGCTI
nr:MAG: hypothetical protein [Bacteriophage sp.]